MRTAVISDLHLAREGALERFSHDTAEFLRFLDFLEAEHERVVLLGVIYETLATRRPGAGRFEFLSLDTRAQRFTHHDSW